MMGYFYDFIALKVNADHHQVWISYVKAESFSLTQSFCEISERCCCLLICSYLYYLD